MLVGFGPTIFLGVCQNAQIGRDELHVLPLSEVQAIEFIVGELDFVGRWLDAARGKTDKLDFRAHAEPKYPTHFGRDAFRRSGLADDLELMWPSIGDDRLAIGQTIT